MKTNAIVRIILFSVLIVGLLGILVTGIAVGKFVSNINWVNSMSGGHVESVGSVDASQIKELDVEWVSGSITIRTAHTDTDTILFSETSGLDNDDKMVWKQSGDKLTIQFEKPSVFFGISFGFNSSNSKDLVITVPADWVAQEIDIKSVSADIDFTDVNASKLNLTNISGQCDMIGCGITDMDVETVSGEVDFNGTLSTIDLDSVSADCTLTLQAGVDRITMECVSGDLTLYLPDNQGFTAELDGISGNITTDFSVTSSESLYRYGDESCRIEGECVSGKVRIYKVTE